MPRPSLKDKRREEILDAYETCVARFGVEGATLERISEEANLARALLRHNIGNRDKLLKALVQRFLEKSNNSTTQMIAQLPTENRIETLIDWLFNPSHSDTQTVLVAEAFIAASATQPSIKNEVSQWFHDFLKTIERELRSEYKAALPDSIEAVSMGITALYFNAESLAPLGPIPKLHSSSKEAAKRLLYSLKE